ncbi:hypothetical protein H0O03_00955 [Candidatus Micrarchaeota archaeon]|nr:hypothetical protein [Candidatus Micrarchaeota archaeon]
MLTVSTVRDKIRQDPQVNALLERIARGTLETFFVPGDSAFDAAHGRIERLWQVYSYPPTWRTLSPLLRQEIFELRKAAAIEQRLSPKQIERINSILE